MALFTIINETSLPVQAVVEQKSGLRRLVGIGNGGRASLAETYSPYVVQAAFTFSNTLYLSGPQEVNGIGNDLVAEVAMDRQMAVFRLRKEPPTAPNAITLSSTCVGDVQFIVRRPVGGLLLRRVVSQFSSTIIGLRNVFQIGAVVNGITLPPIPISSRNARIIVRETDTEGIYELCRAG